MYTHTPNTHKYIHSYTHIHTHTTHTYTHMHIHAHTYIHIHAHTYTYMHAHTFIYTYIHTYINIHTYNTHTRQHTHTYIAMVKQKTSAHHRFGDGQTGNFCFAIVMVDGLFKNPHTAEALFSHLCLELRVTGWQMFIVKQVIEIHTMY